MLRVPVGCVSVTNSGNSDDKATAGTLQLQHVRPRGGRVMAHVDGVRIVMVVAWHEARSVHRVYSSDDVRLLRCPWAG
jgi:hypothetical protein